MAPSMSPIVLAWLYALLQVVLVRAQNYVIFGGTNTVVNTRLDPIIFPGTVCDVFLMHAYCVDFFSFSMGRTSTACSVAADFPRTTTTPS